ncbi:hypothetical protein [Neisseria sp. 83E34]|uniref:hypothetical protein n=1 Tax=Neisseria sp. 83E34 TaxID=1692264 RepID=UPI0006CE6E95|nr:hypothetical protein [Neisseria sp. 83E34]KPN71245.1 hypothetical protein AKG09_07165 [Neisseria sp. 83E34]
MRTYTVDSPEAMARIVCMCIMADSDIDASEFAELQPALYEAIGLNQQEFMTVLAHYLEDIVSDTQGQRINLLQPERVNTLLQEVNGRSERINTLATALRICKSDNALNNAELALFRHIMQHWQLDLTDLEIEVSLA